MQVGHCAQHGGRDRSGHAHGERQPLQGGQITFAPHIGSGRICGNIGLGIGFGSGLIGSQFFVDIVFCIG